MVESVDTRDLKSLGVRAVRVQVPLRVPWENKNNQSNKQCRETTYGWFFCAFNSHAGHERELSSAIHSKKHW